MSNLTGTDDNIKSVVIYARYSDNKQTENSIEGQLKTCKEFAKIQGYTIIREYIDRAQSGRTDNRYQFRKMMVDSSKHQFDGVLVYALDRFGRDIIQTLTNEAKLKENGVVLLSATEENKNSPSGRLNRNMHMAFAQYYSEELAQKVKRGLEIKAGQTIFLGGPVPLGYKFENKHYVIDETTAPIVREIFQRYAEGWSYSELAEDLNKRGIRTSTGALFNKNSFFVILHNRRYLGIYRYKMKKQLIEVPGAIPQIIDEKLFNEVAAKMELNRQAPGRNRAKAEYLLTQKMYCGYCHTMMIGHSSNKVSKNGVIYNYYRCKDAGGKRPCKKKMIQKDYIEDVVVRECKKLLTPANIRRIAKEVMLMAQSDEAVTTMQYYESSIKQKKRELNNQMVSLRKCDDDVLRAVIFNDLKTIQAEIDTLDQQHTLEKGKIFVVSEKQVIDRLSKLAQGDIHNLTYRRSLIHIFVNKIFLYDDRFTITFNTGDEPVTITDVLLDDIEKALGNESFCFSEELGHHEKDHICLPDKCGLFRTKRALQDL